MKTLFVSACVLIAALSVEAGPAPQQQGASAPAAQQNDAPQVLAPDAAPPGGKINPQKAADIQQLIEVTGMKMMMTQMVTSMEARLKPTVVAALPPGDYRDELADLFFEKFNSKMNLQQFLDMAAISYDKYFSDDDIKGLIQFYQTPLGRKSLAVMPKLTVELQSEGLQIGQQMGKESMEEVLREHPDLAKALQDASSH
jgi:uncharacterized protein